jgi:hypothetical protein
VRLELRLRRQTEILLFFEPAQQFVLLRLGEALKKGVGPSFAAERLEGEGVASLAVDIRRRGW